MGMSTFIFCALFTLCKQSDNALIHLVGFETFDQVFICYIFIYVMSASIASLSLEKYFLFNVNTTLEYGSVYIDNIIFLV